INQDIYIYFSNYTRIILHIIPTANCVTSSMSPYRLSTATAKFRFIQAPRYGPMTTSPRNENILINRLGISSGKAATRLSSPSMSCLTPGTFQTCENHSSRSFLVNLLSYRLGSFGGKLRGGPLRKIRMYSMSRVTYAFGGRNPDPRKAPLPL